VANSPQARKRASQNEVRRKHNAGLRSRARTYIKKVEKAIASGNYEEARSTFLQAEPVLDSVVNKGIFTKNKVARHKSRLSARVKALKSG